MYLLQKKMPKREMFDSFCSIDSTSSINSPNDITISDLTISDWYYHNNNSIFDIYTQLKEYINSIGLPILDKCNYGQFIDLCTRQSTLHLYASDSDFSNDSD